MVSATRPAPATRPDPAVVESSQQIELAGLDRRLIALALDGGLAVGSFKLFFDVAESVLPFSSEEWWWIGFALGFFSPVIVPVFFVLLLPLAVAAAGWAGGGQTAGKIVVAAAIRDDDVGYRRPGFRQLFRRECSRGWRILLVLPAFVDHFAALTEPCQRTRHDLAAGTVVVSGRAAHPLGRLLASVVAFVAVFFAAMAAVISLAVAFFLI